MQVESISIDSLGMTDKVPSNDHVTPPCHIFGISVTRHYKMLCDDLYRGVLVHA